MSLLKNKKIILTGGTGFLGSALVKRLLYLQCIPILLIREQSNFTHLERLSIDFKKIQLYKLEEIDFSYLLKAIKPDVVIHCATNYGRNERSSKELFHSNVTLPLTLLQSCVDQESILFINTDTILNPNVSEYAKSKKIFLDWLKFYSPRLRCVNIELEHFYGPYDNPEKFITHVVLKLIEEYSFINLSPGMQKRDFIYIEDVIDAFAHILAFSLSGTWRGVYNFQVGSGEKNTIRDVVFLIKELSKNQLTSLNFGAFDYRLNDLEEYAIDLNQLSQLGWKPKHNLRQGLIKTIQIEKQCDRNSICVI